MIGQILRLQVVPEREKQELAADAREEIAALAISARMIGRDIDHRRDDIAKIENNIAQLQAQIEELREQIAARRRLIETNRAEIAKLQEMAGEAEADAQTLREQIDILEGTPTSEAYNAAFSRIEAGEDPTAVREQFQAVFPGVSGAAFRNAIKRRRRWKEQRETVTQ
jgi:chromosome segregation ATPase